MEHLDIANLSGGKERSGRDWKVESEEEFDLRSAEEAKDKYGRSNQRNEPKPKTAEQGGDRFREAKTKTWSDMVKGLKIDDELETTNSDKSVKRIRESGFSRTTRFGRAESLEGQVSCLKRI